MERGATADILVHWRMLPVCQSRVPLAWTPDGSQIAFPGANRYQVSDKFEYFAVRNAAGVFDTSPLYKYRIAGPDAERFLAGMLARDIRACPPWHAQYTTWLDDRGFVLEDGVIQHLAGRRVPPHQRRAELRLLRRSRRAPRRDDQGRQRRHRRARGPGAALARAARRARPGRRGAPVLRHHDRADRRRAGHRQPHRLHRRPGLRGLGRHARRPGGVGRLWDASEGHGVLPFGAGRAVHAPHRGRAAPAGARTSTPAGSRSTTPIGPPRSSSAGRGCSRAWPTTTVPSSVGARSSASWRTSPRAGR